MQNGHYMLFYINVQNKTKYNFTSAETEQTQLGDKVTHKKVPQVRRQPDSTRTVFVSLCRY